MEGVEGMMRRYENSSKIPKFVGNLMFLIFFNFATVRYRRLIIP